MLDTLFSDQISADLENLNRINRLSEVAGSTSARARSAPCCIAPERGPRTDRRSGTWDRCR
jgi:hypothetical protein